MINVNILSRFSKYSFHQKIGFWNFFLKYEKELEKINIKISFFNKINKKFLEGDKLILNSKFFPLNINDRLSIIKKIYQKNNNLIWYDMRDSSGTTQFDVLPYVNFYLKKQFLKNKELYKKKLVHDRIYCEYYNNSNYKKNDSITEISFQCLDFNYIDKLVLGWNIGIKHFYNYLENSRLTYVLSRLDLSNYLKYTLDFYSFENERHQLINCELGRHVKQIKDRKIIIQQRYLLLENLKKLKYEGLFIPQKNKKNYFQKLIDCKLVLGAFGLGEICNREFEATRLGASFATGNMNHLETWPNIYIPNITYLPLDWDMGNLKDVIDEVTSDDKLRKKLTSNSQNILRNAFNDEGKNYFLNICKKIFL